MEEKEIETLRRFAQGVREEVGRSIDGLSPELYALPARLIRQAAERGGRLHITGIGKPAHIAAYAASLFSSTGVPAYYLHGTEAVHGSCGQLRPGDVVICISNSGGTGELKATVRAVRDNGCAVIAVTGNPGSWLAKHAEASLPAPVQKECGPLNRAPRASVLAELLVLQGLSVVLQSMAEVTVEQYVRWHPGGALGKR